MAWGRSNAAKKPAFQDLSWTPPVIVPATIDWERLVTVDFESYWDDQYTLKKLSTSEYVRDPRFKAQMVGIKIGSRQTKWYGATKIATALRSIPWATHSVLMHHCQFDAFILWERYGISPLRLYDTLSMARALYSNDIGAGLDEVSLYTGGEGKIKDVLEKTKGVLNWSKQLTEEVGPYCVRDVDETLRIFKHMLPHFPAEEIELIDRICRMFTEPVLGVDRPRVEKELAREIAEKRRIMLSFVDQANEAEIKLDLKDLREIAEDLKIPLPVVDKKDLKAVLQATLPKEDVDIRRVKKLIGSSEKFANLLRSVGIDPPVKVSKAWMDTPKDERRDEDKWAYAFSKTDLAFVELKEHADPVVRELVEARFSVKSTTNETRAERFLKASENGAKLPVYLKYSAAHTHRLGGGNKMNMQNLKRGGELRASIEAPPGEVIVVVDSGQIEARTNAWLWGQEDLLEDFRKGDRFMAAQKLLPEDKRKVATGDDRDAYCKFASLVYGRDITTKDKIERFVGKTCLAEGSLVLSERGWVPVEQIQITDRVWDGLEWVCHKGVICNGWKPTLQLSGLSLTPDHLVWSGTHWLEAQCLARDGNILSQALGTAAENLPWQATSPDLGVEWHRSSCNVIADSPNIRWSRTISRISNPCAATHAQKKQPKLHGIGSTSMRWLTTNIAGAFSLASMQQSIAAITPTIAFGTTMANAASWSQKSGATTRQPFSGTFKHCLGGMIRALTSIAKKLTKDMCQATSDSLLAQSMQATSAGLQISKTKSRVFDIACAGPRNRFVALSDSGPLIVHNCVLGLGYQMGAPKLKGTLALGTQGPQVFITDQESRDIVHKYRTKNFYIKNGWSICQKIIEQMAAGMAGSWKCIAWSKETIYLPNGMTMHYPSLRDERFSDESIAKQVAAKLTGEDLDFDPDWPQYVYDSKDSKKKIYGGLLCENIVQALARIIVMNQCLEIVKAKPVKRWVMSTHDEGAFLAKKAAGQKVYDLAHAAFSIPPAWAPDLPLNADGGFDTFYSK